MTFKVFILDGNSQYREMFENAGWEVVHGLNAADLVQFTGGADVSPFIYGETNHPTTGNDPRRDLVEAGYYALCVRMGKPMAGICRGGQFLNVMNGGKMYQDVDGHCRDHWLQDYPTGNKHVVTSTHHQMMLRGPDSELVAGAQESTYRDTFEGGKLYRSHPKETLGMVDTEVLYYSKTNSLCFQPHPEFYGADSTREYYFELLERYLGFKQEA